MTTSGWCWLAAAGVCAVIDWIAVGAGRRRLERIAKPLTMLGLLAVALSAHSAPARSWLVLALLLGLLGDIALVAEQRPALAPAGVQVVTRASARGTASGRTRAGLSADPRPFLIGLSAFLAGHLAYVVALTRFGIDQLSAVFGLLLVLIALLSFGYRVLAGAHEIGGGTLTAGLVLYVVALGSVVVLGVGTGQLWIATGSVLFAASDLMLGYDRFVLARSWSALAVIVTYHLAQGLLVIGLLR